ncbi:unnamed protein product [Sphagnum compactum]
MGATLSSFRRTGAEGGGDDWVDWKHFTYVTFCYRVRAIDTLNKVKIGSAADADNTQWTQISDMIRRYDDEMSYMTLQVLEHQLEVHLDRGDRSIFERIQIVSDAFDTHLLSYLRAEDHLMEKLRQCLPEKNQDWEQFLQEKKTNHEEGEEEDIVSNVQPSAGLEVLKTFKTLTTMLMRAIGGVDEDVNERGESQSVPRAKKIKVFYATNRHVYDCSFKSVLGRILHYGYQEVSIPGVHERGKVESPDKSQQGNPSEHFMLEGKSGLWSEWDEFLEQIRAECNSANDVASSTGGPQKKVLLYIHGYTVSYKSALKRAAQLKNDLEFEGLVILYSWPTRGKPLFYKRDGTVIKRTAPLLRKFITTILREDLFSEVHILAHSMGNRALIKALRRPGWEDYDELVHRKGVLKNVMLAAADEAPHKFQRMLQDVFPENISVHSPIISVYSSACDWPLFVSGYINWDLRLGNTVSLFNSLYEPGPRVDVIDASGVGCNSRLKHSYHAEAREVLDDIQNLLTNYHRAQDRPVIQPFLHRHGQTFHACDPEWWKESKFNRDIQRIQPG